MDFKVILSPRAIQDLQEIVRYIAFDNPVVAENFSVEVSRFWHTARGTPIS
jgi:plasmid stabilization system protein ParE